MKTSSSMQGDAFKYKEGKKKTPLIRVFRNDEF
jgi:hypothetical protein